MWLKPHELCENQVSRLFFRLTGDAEQRCHWIHFHCGSSLTGLKPVCTFQLPSAGAEGGLYLHLTGGRGRASLLFRPFGCCQLNEKQRLVVQQPGSSPWHGLLGQATVGYPTFRILTLPVHKPLLAEVCVACLWQCWHRVSDPARAG